MRDDFQFREVKTGSKLDVTLNSKDIHQVINWPSKGDIIGT